MTIIRNKYCCNTDCNELVEQIKCQRELQDIILVERKKELAGDKVGKVDVIRDTYRQCRDIVEIDMIVDLDITSPFRRLRDVERAI